MDKAVIFDLWNTLLYCPTKGKVGEIREALGLGKEVGYHDIITLMNRTIFIDAEYGLERMFTELCESNGKNPDADQARSAVRLWESRLEESEFFPEAEDTLRDLDDYRLVLLSNTDVGGAEYVKEHGIDGYFDLVIMSCYVGIAKPDRRIYEMALKHLGMDAKDCWMVGDNIECDAHGAHKAGINGILLDRVGESKDKRHPVINNLRQLRGVIEAK